MEKALSSQQQWFRNNHAVGVFGPESEIDEMEGIESPVWFVNIYNKQEAEDDCADTATPVGKVYKVWDFEGAYELGERMAKDRGLDFENFATRA